MNNFQFHSPTEFVFGKGTENKTGYYVKKYSGTNVHCITAVVQQSAADCLTG